MMIVTARGFRSFCINIDDLSATQTTDVIIIVRNSMARGTHFLIICIKISHNNILLI